MKILELLSLIFHSKAVVACLDILKKLALLYLELFLVGLTNQNRYNMDNQIFRGTTINI